MSLFLEGTVKIDIFIFETVKRNTAQRPFWAARRVARKFPACGRELRRGGSADPEHLNAEGWSRPSGGGTQKERHAFQRVFLFGGGGGSRTPVRKRFDGNFSGRRRFIEIPFPEREPSRSKGR